jgi:hypothetical protein
MKRLSVLLITLASLSTAAARAQDIEGDWRGVLQPSMDSRMELRIILKVRRADGGGWKALFYSVNQGGSPIPVTSITLDGFAFNFSVKPLQGSTRAWLLRTAPRLRASGRRRA